MLKVNNIKKSYTTGDFTQHALNGVSVNFRKNEFVAILGPSGSGKTTFLNIIGGLDRYDSGDLIINGKTTADFTESDWDAYRNNSIGFIFQSYNLITHLSIVDNVKMGMTLSGVEPEVKHKKALEALERVGLKDHIHKKPNQLSGGQMQRVAIARALANDPDIILADEPTGALDTETSKQIMDLIKEIAADKLVIMVTHNPDLANEYADRIISFTDGKVTNDTNPFDGADSDNDYELKKTSMSFKTALKLSGKNITTKKWRTALTAFASSIGIIGIALILALSGGFKIQVDKYQSNALSEFPIMILPMSANYSDEDIQEMKTQFKSMMSGEVQFADTTSVKPYDLTREATVHINKLDGDFESYIDNIDPSICNSVSRIKSFPMNVLYKTSDGGIKQISLSQFSTADFSSMYSTSGMGISTYPETLGENQTSYLESNYDILAGSYPKNENEIVMVVDTQNRVDKSVLESLGFDVSDDKDIPFDEIVGTQYKFADNDLMYTYNDNYKLYMKSSESELASIYNNDKCETLTVSGVVRIKGGTAMGFLSTGIAYSEKLVDKLIEKNESTAVYKAQSESDTPVFFSSDSYSDKSAMLSALGGNSSPVCILVYPYNFETKDAVIQYLDKYNEGKSEDDTVVYTDLSSTITEMTGSIMDAITIVLIAFAAISLVVSLIMIAIITYISVLERTKEIGVLRALGARSKDITRVFNAETFITGLCSGTLGIAIAYVLIIPINIIIYNMTGLSGVAKLNPLYALALMALSLILTVLGGFIPAKMAAKKDPVLALRTE